MKKTFALVFAIFIALSLFSQEVEKNLFKIDFLLPGVSYEHKLSKYSTLVINPLLGVSYAWYNEEDFYSITPNVNFEYRYYYNFARRENLGKNTAYNTANYLAPRIIMAFPSIMDNYDDQSKFGMAMGGVYGLQRTYNSGIYILGEAGLGYGGDALFPILTFKIGYTFKNK